MKDIPLVDEESRDFLEAALQMVGGDGKPAPKGAKKDKRNTKGIDQILKVKDDGLSKKATFVDAKTSM